ncbi:MAG: peptidylprolyl isomerase [Clostridia bacterium]|nr:peptidylprolyl isomerase [Clostridia bacterium]
MNDKPRSKGDYTEVKNDLKNGIKEQAGGAKDSQHQEDHKKSREEVVIKYGFLALGIILIVCIIAFAIVSILPKYALSIGDYKVKEEEFEYHYFEQKNMVFQQVLAAYPDVTEEVFLNSEYSTGMTYHELIKQLAMERIADIHILLDMAKNEGYEYDEVELSDSKDNFEQSFKEYASQINMSPDEASNEIYGCDFDVVLFIYENTWISGKYQDDKMREYEMAVTEEEAEAYYEKFKDDLDQVTLRQIFIATYDVETQQYFEDEQYQEAKTRAEAVFERINAGEDFDALIVELSEDPALEDTGGEYKSKKSEIGLPELEEWAFSEEREEGNIEMVETQIGFHIVKYMARTGYDEALDTVKGNIAYGIMLNLLSEKKQLPEYEIGYYEAFKRY